MNKKANNKEKINPIPWLIGLLCIALIVGGIFLYLFLDEYFSYSRLDKNADGTLYDPKTEITYTMAPEAYKAVLIVTNPQFGFVEKIPLYSIAYRNIDDKVVALDSERYLSMSNDDGGALYYNADEVTLPTLENFDHGISHVCSTEGVIFARAELTKTDTYRVIKGFNEGAATRVEGRVKENFTLRIKSEKYDWLYYCMRFTITEAGEYFVTDYISGKTVKADPEIFDEFFGVPKAPN